MTLQIQWYKYDFCNLKTDGGDIIWKHPLKWQFSMISRFLWRNRKNFSRLPHFFSKVILYNKFPIEVIWTLLLICTCIHFNSEFSLLLGSYLQLRHYIKKPVALFFFSCDGIKVRTFTFALTYILYTENWIMR